MVITSSEGTTGLKEFVKKKEVRFIGYPYFFILYMLWTRFDMGYRIDFFFKKSFHFFIVAIQQQSNKLSLIKFLFITKISDYYIGILYSEDSNETIS